uniref:Uncharacterized protein n=1 Tax=Glossina brevipalpis TaxID=37001 RepID=A0A1A9W0X0_9MUSC
MKLLGYVDSEVTFRLNIFQICAFRVYFSNMPIWTIDPYLNISILSLKARTIRKICSLIPWLVFVSNSLRFPLLKCANLLALITLIIIVAFEALKVEVELKHIKNDGLNITMKHCCDKLSFKREGDVEHQTIRLRPNINCTRLWFCY